MKQYCRYCANLVYGGHGPWCEVKEELLSEHYAKRVNNCKNFDFCEIDAFMENPNPYRPRKSYKQNEHFTKTVEQISLFEV